MRGDKADPVKDLLKRQDLKDLMDSQELLGKAKRRSDDTRVGPSNMIDNESDIINIYSKELPSGERGRRQ